jgi:hypothetical protein
VISRGVLLLALAAAGCEDAARTLPLEFPDKLSQAGLYDDLLTRKLAANVIAFSPDHILWSDGADKARWISLPEGKKIDGSDPDHWVFPIGTRFFKEFSLQGRPLETRLILRVGDSGDYAKDYLAGAYLWDDDERDASFVIDGRSDVRGTQHDVPARADCWRCHIGEPGHILGFQAVQLAHAGENAPARLVERGLLDHTPSGAVGLAPDTVAARAQGWLHANCGHCHNENGNAWPQTHMVLRLTVGEHDPASTALYESTVGVRLDYYKPPAGTPPTFRIAPGSPSESVIIYRDSVRGSPDSPQGYEAQMPPLASELVDLDGVSRVQTWIETLSPR